MDKLKTVNRKYDASYTTNNPQSNNFKSAQKRARVTTVTKVVVLGVDNSCFCPDGRAEGESSSALLSQLIFGLNDKTYASLRFLPENASIYNAGSLCYNCIK
jgi:hypothetical protein